MYNGCKRKCRICEPWNEIKKNHIRHFHALNMWPIWICDIQLWSRLAPEHFMAQGDRTWCFLCRLVNLMGNGSRLATLPYSSDVQNVKYNIRAINDFLYFTLLLTTFKCTLRSFKLFLYFSYLPGSHRFPLTYVQYENQSAVYWNLLPIANTSLWISNLHSFVSEVLY